MKNVKKRAVGLLLTAALLASALLPAGCKSRESKDIEQIKEVTEQFFEAYASGNTKDMEDLVDEDFSYNFYDDDKDKAEVVFKVASKTEIEEFKSIEVDRKNLRAKARIKISYIDMQDFIRHDNGLVMTKDDYLEAADSFTKMSTANLSFSYVFDEDEGQWKLRENSADKYSKLLKTSTALRIASMTADEAKAAFESVIPGLAKGELEQKHYGYSIYNVRLFDDGNEDDQTINDAALEFLKAYFGYIEDHGLKYDYDKDNPYAVTVTGSAPSREAILDYFGSDEYIQEMYMAYIRIESLDSAYSDEEIWSQFYAGIYYDLAKQIDKMWYDEYSVSMSLDPMSKIPQILISPMLFPITANDTYVARQTSDEQNLRCLQKAVEALYLAGELKENEYKEYMEEIERERNSRNNQNIDLDNVIVDTGSIGSGKYGNQAVGTYEYTPEWSDGTLIYGASSVDNNGIFMHYSKEPGWLNTAGYNISVDGITVMVKFDHEFSADTPLIYDWYVDGEHYGDSVSFKVEEDGTVDFEFTLPDVQIRKYGTCEFRLWEADHAHVIAYVKLTKT